MCEEPRSIFELLILWWNWRNKLKLEGETQPWIKTTETDPWLILIWYQSVLFLHFLTSNQKQISKNVIYTWCYDEKNKWNIEHNHLLSQLTLNIRDNNAMIPSGLINNETISLQTFCEIKLTFVAHWKFMCELIILSHVFLRNHNTMSLSIITRILWFFVPVKTV